MGQHDPAVLLIGFNRPELLTRVIDRVREAAPPRVFLAVDGPRSNVPGDADRVKRTRDCVNQLDWGCSVVTRFQESNLGCGRAVSGAIDWFFEHVEEGVIIEDDILPDRSFFPYAADLLDRYRADTRVIGISGSSYLPPGVAPVEFSYRFSMIPNIWGWATWRDRWQRYRFDISGWRRELSVPRLWRLTHRSPWAFAYWSAHFDLVARHRIDTWDLQWVEAAMRTNGVTATPNVNLAENIGWGEGSTHTQSVPDDVQPVQAMSFPLRHPSVRWDAVSDAWTNTHAYGATFTGTIRRARRALSHAVDWSSRSTDRQG